MDDALQPQYVVVADQNILDDAVRAQSASLLEKSLSQVDADYQIVTRYTARGLQKLGPLNFMSYALNFMVNKGVSVNSLFLILMLPIMATIIA